MHFLLPSPSNRPKVREHEPALFTVVRRVLLRTQRKLLESLLLGQGLVDEGARLFLGLAPSAADDAIDAAIQDVEALLENRSQQTMKMEHRLSVVIKRDVLPQTLQK